MRARRKDGELDECDKVPMLYRMLQYKYSKDEPMPDADILSEAMAHMYGTSCAIPDVIAHEFEQNCWYRHHVRISLLLCMGALSPPGYH